MYAQLKVLISVQKAKEIGHEVLVKKEKEAGIGD